jgi:hypothetical protein
MIEQARHSHKYFAPVYESTGEYYYRFKTSEEYESEQGVHVPVLNFTEELTCLDDLVNFVQISKVDKQETKECFVDFIKGIFNIDPRKRWTADMSRQHPFISRKKYEGPFVPKREQRPVVTQSSIDEHDENSDSSSVTGRNKSDEMYEKLGSCPSQILRDPSEFAFNKSSKKPISEEKKKEIFNNRSYRPPILSLDVEYFKGFNFNSLDSISEGFKDMIYNQSKALNFKIIVPQQKQNNQKSTNAFTSTFQSQNAGYTHQNTGFPLDAQAYLPQQPMGYQQNAQNWQFNQNQMNYSANQVPQSMQYQIPYGYQNQPGVQYPGYNTGQLPMTAQPQMMGNTYSMQPQFMASQPQQQNYAYGACQSYQMNMPNYQPTDAYAQNQFYQTQDPWTNSHTGNDMHSQGFGNYGQDPSYYPHEQVITPGDPHPSLFKTQDQKTKVKVRQDHNTQLRAGSWDPKFLQKGDIKKFQHNNGQGYTEGQISSWQNIKKSSGYSKVKRNKKFKQKLKNSKGFNTQSIFSQAFGEPQENEQDRSEGMTMQNQMPYVGIQDPPKTATFDTFYQNLPKSKKSSENTGQMSSLAFTNKSFASTFKMEGPLKSSRVQSNEPVTSELNKVKLKKSRSNNVDEVMNDQSAFSKFNQSKFSFIL